ncbi:MAG: transcription-repair coupling factor [Deltaproteobacteria bacterium]|nr:transcription-repair coupling factor [Deltaproteobacteria bacterium]
MSAPTSIFERIARRAGALAPGESLSASGFAGDAEALALARLSVERPVVAVCPDGTQADALYRALRAFLPGGTADAPRVLRLPADEILPYDALSPDPQVAQARLGALFHLRFETGARVLVLSVASLYGRVLAPATLDRHARAIALKDLIDRDELAHALLEAGYHNVPLCEDPGTYALRGGILDCFSPLYRWPLRIEFFGDEIDSLRFYDPATQRTVETVADAFLPPAREVLFDARSIRNATLAARELADEMDRPSRQIRGLLDEIERGQAGFGIEALLPGFYDEGLVSLGEYLPEGAVLALVRADACEEAAASLDAHLEQEYAAARDRSELVYPPQGYFIGGEEREALHASLPTLRLGELILAGDALHQEVEEAADEDEGVSPARVPEGERPLKANQQPTALLRQEILAGRDPEGALAPLVSRLKRWRDAGHTVILSASSAGRADRLKQLLLGRALMVKTLASSEEAPAFDPARPRAFHDPSVHAHLLRGELEGGFVDGEAGLVVLSDAEILGKPKEGRHQKKAGAKPEEIFAERFRDLAEGDLVIHVEHGIARYGGLTRLSLRGVEGDFLELHFAGKDKIYLPVHRLGLVQKYVGGKEEATRLDKLGSQAFAVRKKKVKEELLKMAAELLEIYAARKAHPGTAFSPPDTAFRHFETGFAYEETNDQARAIHEVIVDMQRDQPMDRLVCGDVGFGKTEVAMRAAMKAVIDGKQVAVLVPTTVLAAQHESSFKERFAGFPVSVEGVSRFRPKEEIRDVLARAKEGKVDILIGTHRLLSKDVGFKDLGLLVVDEEQRFGVKQKEALKRLRKQVDVLTLTATPIPRTLNMSLSGIRDLSIIATPPMDRRAIRTFVTRFDGPTIKEAVERELARGGQVFFVHNRVKSIGGVYRYLRELLPDVKIEVAHGQMTETKLETAMTRFVKREADLLLCTAIIESGLDIPSVNTILISRSDMFGLAQLYQLRGRVGRSRERAYCYLLVPARRPITPDARKRLTVLQELGELGAGFRLASHDLEIRGAGNLLGHHQSGQIEAVGFDLYSQMLDDAVRELRGQPPREHFEPEVTLPVPAFLPDDYIPDIHQRLTLYKRATSLEGEEEIAAFREELVDRYGHLPGEAENLLAISRIRHHLARLHLRSLESGPGRLVITLGDEARLDPLRLAAHIEKVDKGHRGRLRLSPELRLSLKLPGVLEGEALFEAAVAFIEEIDRAAGG